MQLFQYATILVSLYHFHENKTALIKTRCNYNGYLLFKITKKYNTFKISVEV